MHFCQGIIEKEVFISCKSFIKKGFLTRLKEYFKNNALSIFVKAPSVKELKKRLSSMENGE